MIPDSTKIWAVIVTVNQNYIPYELYTILRVVETTWGELNKGSVPIDYQNREQVLTFLRTDDPPWK